MTTLSVFTWIGNAAAAVCGKHGDITRQAEQVGCSRQTVYDHAAKVEKAIVDAQRPGPSRQQLLEEVAALRQENQELWHAYLQAIDFPESRQQQFATCASALGLSLSQILFLLAILLPPSRRPSRATLGRWVNHAARRAGRLLSVLDQACRGLVLSLCRDEIFFHRKPVLMGIEPQSMAWVLGQRANDRSGDTWAVALQVWPHVQDVAIDGGTGLQRGLEKAAQQRQQAAAEIPDGRPAKPLHPQLDVFHTRRDGGRVLRQRWKYAQKCWDQAVDQERAKQRSDRMGVDGRKFSQAKVTQAWAKALAEFEKVCREEQAWLRACTALAVWRPDGQLNDRQWAEAELAQAVAELTGPLWAKVCRQLLDVRTLTFLDRMHQKLASVAVDAECLAALAALWRWRRARRQVAQEKAVTAVGMMEELLLAVVKAKLGQNWKEPYRQVSQVLRGVIRASSAVECVNSVVRMHQSRHRTLSQELLDLKRLFWNCRSFLEGKRKRHCPYELLGLRLQSYDPWKLLQFDPAQLDQFLSTAQLAA